jgi:hypothetical protein
VLAPVFWNILWPFLNPKICSEIQRPFPDCSLRLHRRYGRGSDQRWAAPAAEPNALSCCRRSRRHSRCFLLAFRHRRSFCAVHLSWSIEDIPLRGSYHSTCLFIPRAYIALVTFSVRVLEILICRLLSACFDTARTVDALFGRSRPPVRHRRDAQVFHARQPRLAYLGSVGRFCTLARRSYTRQ